MPFLNIATSCDEAAPPTTQPALNGQPAATGASDIAVPAAPPSPPPPDFLEASRFSPKHYSDMLQRLFPVDRELQKATGALLETSLDALDDDGFWGWDHFYRDGAVVLLGEKNGKVIGLTQRYFTDIKYPDIKLLPDMMGYADIHSQFLTVFDNRGNCQKKVKASKQAAASCRQHRFRIVRYESEQAIKPDQVQAQTFEDHDITLLYFSKDAPIISERETMEIPRPVQLVENHIRTVSNWYGFEFTLISKSALAEMRAKIKHESLGEQLLLSAAAMALGPMISQLTSQLSLPAPVMKKMQEKVKDLAAAKVANAGVNLIDSLGKTGTPVEDHKSEQVFTFFPKDVKTKARLSELPLTSEGCLSLHLAKKDIPVCPLGISVPGAGAQADALASYLSKTIVGAEITLANFPAAHGTQRAMVLIPIEQVNLNFELLRHGLVKLDVTDVRALKAFPELIQASQAALDAETGFARDWKNDAEYVAQVQHAATY